MNDFELFHWLSHSLLKVFVLHVFNPRVNKDKILTSVIIILIVIIIITLITDNKPCKTKLTTKIV